jgi:muramoyltetrapeptide carboxypeptidase
MIKIPSLLKKGDRVAIVAPSGKVNKENLIAGLNMLKQWGLEPIVGKHVFDDYLYFSSNDENRLYDLQTALDDKNIKAIFCARGGYGITRIIDKLDFSSFLNHPKWVIGYSDITLLLNKIQNLDVATIHGPMVSTFYKYKNTSVKKLYNLLFNGKIKFSISSKNIHNYYRKAEYQAIITGGNLTMLCNSIGTPFQFNAHNKIIFLEETNEEPYRIERLFYQLHHGNFLNNSTGIILGNFSYKKQKDFPFTINSEFIKKLFPQLNFCIKKFPAGHGRYNYPIIFNHPIKIIIKNDRIFFSQNLT